MSCDQTLTATSEDYYPEEALNGYCRAEIEQIVLNLAHSILEEMGLEDEVQLHGARVYGSRSREGLYRSDSDIDVVLSYSGDFREDDFFNALSEESLTIDGLTIDINPISTEKTGSLEDYLRKAENYLERKEQSMRKPSIRKRLKMSQQKTKNNQTLIQPKKRGIQHEI